MKGYETYGGKKIPVCRYYIDKLDISPTVIKSRSQKALFKILRKLKERYPGLTEPQYYQHMYAILARKKQDDDRKSTMFSSRDDKLF